MRTPAHPFPSKTDRLFSPGEPTWFTGATARVRIVIDAVSDEFFVDPVDIISGCYSPEAIEARMACYWVMKKISRLSNIQIARCFGRKDHTTVGNGLAKTEQRRAVDPLFREMTDAALLKSESARPKLLAA